MSAMTNAELLDSTAARIESFLVDRAPRLAHAPAPLSEAVGAIAKKLGATPAHGVEPAEGEPFESALERIAGAAKLMVTPLSLDQDAVGDHPAPILARRTTDQAPVALRRVGGKWRVARPENGYCFETVAHGRLDPLEENAWRLLPALPDGPISSRKLLRFGLVGGYRDLIGFALLTLLAGGLAALLPLVTDPLLSIVAPEHDRTLLAQAAVFLIAAMIANLLARFAASYAKLRLDGRSALLVRAASIQRALSFAEHQARESKPIPPAPVAALSSRSLEGWRRGVWGIGLSLTASVLAALPSILVLARTSFASFAVLAATFTGGVALAGWIAMRRSAAIKNGVASQQSWMTTSYEALAMIDTVRAGAAENALLSRWSDGFLSLRHRFLHSERIGTASAGLEASFGSLLILAAMAAMALSGEAATGAASVSFVVAAGAVAGAGAALMSALGETAMLAVQRKMIAPILDADIPSVLKPTGAVVSEIGGALEIKGVSCRSGPTGPVVLQDLNLSIEPGEHIGITGPSGAGKSTLLKLMLGLIRPESGYVLLDGRDLSMLDAASFRRRIGVVGQGARLFPGTLLDNIAAGLSLTPDEAMEAARMAAFDDELAGLPLGLSTPIGDAESGFSGGQVQRILLARAFAAKPKLLVLDEATSALDPARQARVAASIDSLQATVISVAHRLETLERCDRIVVLDKGCVAETGSFDALMAADGLFAALAAHNPRLSEPVA